MAQGTVKWFNDFKGYGFITPHAPGDDVYVHFSAIQGRGYRTLREGQTVKYEIQRGDEGFHEAHNVQIVL
jgi:CspA family cold shock protein